MSRKLLAQLTVEELRQRADELDSMAARASTESTRNSLESLAKRFRARAVQRDANENLLFQLQADPAVTECAPGTPAPDDGRYQLTNVFGSLTSQIVRAARGEVLPAAPRGFTWRLMPDQAPPPSSSSPARE